MNFFDGKRAVVRAVSMVALVSVALGLAVPESTVKSVGQPIVIIENLVIDIPPVAATCSNPVIKPNCRVDVASYGFNDLSPCGYVNTSGGSSDVILDPISLGIILFELDATTCTTRNRQQFDTWAIKDDRSQMIETLLWAPSGTIIVGVTAGSAETEDLDLRSAANWFFVNYNMNLTAVGLESRKKFAFVLQKGYPKKTLHWIRERYDTKCLEASFTLSGSTVAEATFKSDNPASSSPIFGDSQLNTTPFNWPNFS